jgi:hypothetical protein
MRTNQKKNSDKQRKSVGRGVAAKTGDVAALIEREPPTFQVLFIPEPELVFRDGQCAITPKVGINRFGAFGSNLRSDRQIRVGIVGDSAGIQRFSAFLTRGAKKVVAGWNQRKDTVYNPVLFPDYPGSSSDVGFCAQFITSRQIQCEIKPDSFGKALCGDTANSQIRAVADLVLAKLELLKQQDPEPDVVAIVLPNAVEELLRSEGMASRGVKLTPLQRVAESLRKEKEETNQDVLLLDFGKDAEVDLGNWNIHHAIKARAMDMGLTTQIVWESTLDPATPKEDPATTAWNIFTALYYKANNVPWKVKDLPSNTCFVGISFYYESPLGGANLQSSLAQVFSGNGDGLVLKGRPAVKDKKRDRQPHLKTEDAELLLRQAIDEYTQAHDDVPPARVVVHKTSRYWSEELDGFKRGLGNIQSFDFLTIGPSDVRFLRVGHKPPMRGTAVILGERHYVLFTTGYIPALHEYPGFRVPRPLEISEHHGQASPETICRELLMLTKINWNSCRIDCAEPITTQFAKRVGMILTEVKGGTPREKKYKFYM